MIIYESNQQNVGEGKEQECEQITVGSLQLHDLPEYPSYENRGIGAQESHHHSHDGSGAIPGSQFHQPFIEHRQRIEKEGKHRMPVFRIIHFPFGECEISIWVEPRYLEIFGKDGPVTYISILAEICIVVGYHQHVEGNNEQEGYERKEPFFFLNLEYIVHP